MPRRKYNKPKKVPQAFIDWMDGYCSAFDDFPDGAWQAAGEQAVDVYNAAHGTHIDQYEGWLQWVLSHPEATKDGS